MPLLEIKDLCVSYSSGNEVLKDVSFSCEAGDFIFIQGESGCGKSTLMHVINGVIPFFTKADLSGEIKYQGKSILTEDIVKRSRYLGSVLQNADDQIIHDVVEDEVAFALENLGVESHKMADIIKTAITPMKLRPEMRTATLSGGEKQRLITATTLAMEQKLILLDEPLANLDAIGAKYLLETLKHLCETRQYSVIMVEHRKELVLPYCNRVLTMQDGCLQETNINNVHSMEADSIQLDNRENVTSNLTSSKQALINLHDIEVSFQGKTILSRKNFELQPKDRWVILGENGCGKTTLLKVLAGVLKPTRGRRVIQKIDGRSARIGMVMQNPNYQLFMSSVEDEILCGARDKKLAEELLESFGLQEYRSVHPQCLSEGQKRRLGVAAILATQPDVLILDEPTVGQDQKSMDIMLKEIEKMVDRHQMALVTVTHDYRCLQVLGDKLLHLQKESVS